MQPGTNLVRREGLPVPLGTHDDHAGGGDAGQAGQAEKSPVLHE
jgi:hypothetical protein